MKLNFILISHNFEAVFSKPKAIMVPPVVEVSLYTYPSDPKVATERFETWSKAYRETSASTPHPSQRWEITWIEAELSDVQMAQLMSLMVSGEVHEAACLLRRLYTGRKAVVVKHEKGN